jgi:hypothetical protein
LDRDEPNLIALVVHRQEDTLAYVSDALEMFEPGFRVATATSLAAAEAWTVSIRLDWLFASVDAIPQSELADFVDGLDLPRHRVILLGGNNSQLPGSVIMADPPLLSEILHAIRSDLATAPARDGFISQTHNIVAS